jgi:formylmethanofuran dehydrogenase subunit E
MKASDIMARDDFKNCAAFHGHICGGLAIGYNAAQAGLRWLDSHRALDEELVAIVETDACCVDAIQVLTGCTFGKGNLIYRDYGKMCFTFFNRATGQGVRLSMKKGLPPNPRQTELFAKMREGSISEDERAELQQLGQRRTEELLEAGAETLFDFQEVTESMPAKARIAPSKPCAKCGEPTMETKLEFFGGEMVCRRCLTD